MEANTMAFDTVTYKPKTSQVVAYTGTAAASTAFTSGVDVIRIVASTACHVKVNATALANGTCMFMPADQVEYIKVDAGDTISAIQDASGGNLYITEMAR
jgi:Cu/Ag efflux protein CusF